MDSLMTAAARALAAGDPLGALQRVALREDAPALALRGIAMAQLGDFDRAKALLRRAARAFGPTEAVARARCVVADAEIALASRNLGWPARKLEAAQATLDAHGDPVNAAHARSLTIRRLLLVGELDEAERRLDAQQPPSPPALRAVHELLVAGIAVRRLKIRVARSALDRAARAARSAGIPALTAEIDDASTLLRRPAARAIARGRDRPLLLEDIEDIQGSSALVVDATRHVVHDAGTSLMLAKRPLLFVLLRMLGEAWPDDVARDALIGRAFRAKHVDDTHRVRLRVELGRLRRLLYPMARIEATSRGFVLAPRRAGEVIVLARLVDEPHAAMLACLADGEAWSSSALALALGAGQRTVQRALDSLAASGKVQFIGGGRKRRWMAPPLTGFATTLLLPTLLPPA